MGDFRLEPELTIGAGRSGCGKTTFLCRWLLNTPAACRFVFDDLGRVASRLRISPARTAADCERMLAARWVIFSPHVMFPGDVAAGFRWFCSWVFEASKRGPGRKLVGIDEAWQFCSPHSLPRELATLAQAGREEGVWLYLGTQRPHKLNESITGQATELVCFSLAPGPALEKVVTLADEYPELAAEIRALPLGSFVSVGLVKRGKVRGRVF